MRCVCCAFVVAVHAAMARCGWSLGLLSGGTGRQALSIQKQNCLSIVAPAKDNARKTPSELEIASP
jgi:hypothetical protein